jgi:hypothetical protein
MSVTVMIPQCGWLPGWRNWRWVAELSLVLGLISREAVA